ncbi:MAG: TetR/AcrR family transcriptional regulator C-terminal domain-containing protein [Polyangiaceae bacterium]
MSHAAATSPFERIASDLRRRIAVGSLKPGDRLPSTRDLARTWKVAPATAAHALRALAEEGIIRATPRVGNVVSGALPSRAQSEELSARRVAAAAIELCDLEGISALSIRSVAARLGVGPMSLYRHVRSKAELLHLMTDVVLGEEPLPDPPPRGWRAQLELSSRLEWRVFSRHPWLARVVHITRPEPLPNAIAFADWVLRALDELGLDGREKMRIHLVLHSFVQGLAANLEAESEAARATGMTEDDWMRTKEARFTELATSGRFPAFARTLADIDDGFDLEFDRLFELGLSTILDGLEATHALAKQPRRKHR